MEKLTMEQWLKLMERVANKNDLDATYLKILNQK